MESYQPTRRNVLWSGAAIAAAAAAAGVVRAQVESLGKEFVDSPTARAGNQAGITFVLREADGSALTTERAKTMTVRDLHGDPLPQPVALSAGRAQIPLAKEPLEFTLRLSIPNFGEVYCYADNEGKGYSAPATLDYVAEAVKTRIYRVRRAVEEAVGLGISSLPDIMADLDAAVQLSKNEKDQYEALWRAMRAGEALALESARQRIAHLAGPRKNFLFGCMIAGYDSSPKYNKAIEDAYNYATVCWYTWKAEEPAEKRIDYTRMDRSIEWCLKRGIKPKGFAYTYMAHGATAEWTRPAEHATTRGTGGLFNERWGYERLLELYKHVDEETARRYRDKLEYIEVINEAHDKANLWKLNHEQILEMVRESCAAVRRGSATVKRQMNHCCLWAEYAKTANPDGSRRWSPYTYIRDCLAHGVEFEVVGLQLYYPQYDLFEIDRMLDRFADFGRPCHITELATQSKDGEDAESMRPHTPTPGWHGPWSEEMQADWLEAIYTLCYSKAHFEAVGWWDMADTPGHFWPFGGVLNKDFTPKLSYFRLLELQKRWGVSKGGS